MVVFREVGRHPVDQHADSALMQVIDEVHEILRRSVPACRCIITNRLVAPRTRKRMLIDRHQFNVSEIHPVAIIGQPMRQVSIAQPTMSATGAFLPTAEMDFVNIHRLLLRIDRGASRQPIGIVPEMLAKVRDDRRGQWWQLSGETKRIAFIDPFTLLGQNPVLVLVADFGLWREQFPNAKMFVNTSCVLRPSQPLKSPTT